MQNFVSNRLKLLIDVLGLNLKEFSKATGIPYRTLQEYLYGKSLPGSENLIKIYTKFSVNLNWLLTGEGEMFLKKSEVIDIKDAPLINIIQFLKEFWSKASEKEKIWLEIQFEKCFPDFKEWLTQKEQESLQESNQNLNLKKIP
jgi:transcriptional regulator with XRE-family HTH domain